MFKSSMGSNLLKISGLCVSAICVANFVQGIPFLQYEETSKGLPGFSFFIQDGIYEISKDEIHYPLGVVKKSSLFDIVKEAQLKTYENVPLSDAERIPYKLNNSLQRFFHPGDPKIAQVPKEWKVLEVSPNLLVKDFRKLILEKQGNLQIGNNEGYRLLCNLCSKADDFPNLPLKDVLYSEIYYFYRGFLDILRFRFTTYPVRELFKAEKAMVHIYTKGENYSYIDPSTVDYDASSRKFYPNAEKIISISLQQNQPAEVFTSVLLDEKILMMQQWHFIGYQTGPNDLIDNWDKNKGWYGVAPNFSEPGEFSSDSFKTKKEELLFFPAPTTTQNVTIFTEKLLGDVNQWAKTLEMTVFDEVDKELCKVLDAVLDANAKNKKNKDIIEGHVNTILEGLSESMLLNEDGKCSIVCWLNALYTAMLEANPW